MSYLYSVERMILEVLSALGSVHGFKNSIVTQKAKEITFIAEKPLWKNYIGARVLLKLHSDRKGWKIISFVVETVDLAGLDLEKESFPPSDTQVCALPGIDFFVYMGKTLDKRHPWAIKTPQDIVAFFEAYDEAAIFFGKKPVFLS
jgi:hypothetical protein